MNDQIKRIADRVDAWFDEDGHSYSRPAWNEKFAEFLILECLSFREELSQFDRSTEYGDGYEDGLKDFVETISEHFGVEQ